MSKYVHYECNMCCNVWDSDGYMTECPFCGNDNEKYISQSESDERLYPDFFYSEEE